MFSVPKLLYYRKVYASRLPETKMLYCRHVYADPNITETKLLQSQKLKANHIHELMIKIFTS